VWSQVGQGSTFTIRIPAHLHKAAPAARDQATFLNRQRPPEQPFPERQEISQ
jgi:hypothetical protein